MMLLQPSNSRPNAFAAGIVAVLSFYTVDARAADGPFSSMAGYWAGSGTISMQSGSRERIRCRAIYAVSSDGTALNQSLLCASDSYKIDVNSNVSEDGGVLTGNWTETTLNATGIVSGRVEGPVIEAIVTGLGFTAALSLVTRAKTESATIRPSGGTDIVDVTVTLRRE
jgi:hypothetical protein